ncbi:MAG TPA: MFS transporter [Nocardioides sp.]|uniref:MFS transporter n=1 Tax=Nocardioides sp. TaxID=35761 RepID=UPI002E3415E7|nr:MFS transporter [Nocardioides sp.]HEX3930295.1 MFS transporter [Nocardioides sp.]
MNRNRWALVAVALATFMTYLDNNIVNVAIPDIQRELGLSTAGIEWVVSGYILTFAGLLLAGGRLADAFGRRRLFLIGLAVFTASSVLAGFADAATTLIAARALQGIGAAAVTPTTLAIISATFTDPRERNAAVGIWGGVGALALAVGPVLGGALTQHVSWEWIFWINLPVGIVTMALGAWAIRESREDEVRRMDLPGLGLSTLTLFTLTWALIEGHDLGWTSTGILGAFGVAAVSALAFVVVESRVAQPMVDVSLFRRREFTGGIVALMLWAFGLFGIYFFTSLYLQGVLGFSPTKAGSAFVPMALLMAASAIVSDRVAVRFGAYRSTGFGMLAMGAGIGATALLGQGASFLSLMPSFAVIGVGGGLTIPLTATVLGVMPTSQAGVASAVFNASREVAGLLGITVIGAVLTSRQSSALASGHTPVQAYLIGYHSGLYLAAALVVAGGAMAFGALRKAHLVADVDATREDLVLAG